jgi:Ca2+-transporting ATPase
MERILVAPASGVNWNGFDHKDKMMASKPTAKPPDPAVLKGLSREEVRDRLARDGYNELQKSKPRTGLQIAFSVLKEPMFLLLIGAGSVYLLLGDPQEAAMLMAFVFVIIGITYYQERKTERALDALRALSSPKSWVFREGKRLQIWARELVTGDIMILKEGDRIPADGKLLSGISLSVDESLLTGESVPVRKRPWLPEDIKQDPGGDDQPFVYAGTLAVQGEGVAEVTATGPRSELGLIGESLKNMKPEPTVLQRHMNRLIHRVLIFGGFTCLLMVGLYGWMHRDWLQALLAGIALAMAMMPEEFPVVFTVFLALGAWRISKKNVLTRDNQAIETLGAITVLCVDKTGTLTTNGMSLDILWTEDEVCNLHENRQGPLSASCHALLETARLASQHEPFDPMERAIRETSQALLSDGEVMGPDLRLAHEYPLSPEMLAMSRVWEMPGRDEKLVASKGAPEAIMDLCHLPSDDRERLTREVNELADAGLRVIGVARSLISHTEGLPELQHDFDYELLGFLGFLNPVRETVPAAMATCRQAGIRVIMMTGDSPATARAVARQVGISPSDAVLTGREISVMSDEELSRRVEETGVFCRVLPEHKLRLMTLLKANGHVAAMTGDGVNDAPALKKSSIGIAMGERGTDVAREASDLVLLNDDFTSIVEAIRLGRRTFDNLRKSMAYILAIHIPIAGLSLLPILMQFPLVLFPAHIVFQELLIDPACSLVFEAEPEEGDIMRRQPRAPAEPILNRRTVLVSLSQGLILCLICMAVLWGADLAGRPHDVARAMTFTVLMLGNLGLIMADRSLNIAGETSHDNASPNGGNQTFRWIAAVTLVGLAAILTNPSLRVLFHFEPMSGAEFLVCLLSALVALLLYRLPRKLWGAR